MTADRDVLAARWRRLLAPHAAPALIEAALAAVVDAYSAPERHYHTLTHVRAVLETLDRLLVPLPPAVELAGWLHDVVYDPRASDNEARSADYARTLTDRLGLPADVGAEAARLIRLTHTHQADAADRTGQALLDADLAILAAAPAVYDAYAGAIRREYAWVSDTAYRTGRRRVLEAFLARPRLYHTAAMQPCEPQARDNLAREIARLGEAGSS